MSIYTRNLDTGRQYVVNFIYRLVYLCRKSPRYAQNSGLEGILKQSGCWGRECILLTVMSTEPKLLGVTASNKVTVPTVLFVSTPYSRTPPGSALVMLETQSQPSQETGKIRS
jgi:hypothetical protein